MSKARATDSATISELRLLLDIPEDEPIFGFNEYARILTKSIIGTYPQFTMGIFGKWGTGKSTLLKRIEHLLKTSHADKAMTVSFDAWRYHHEEHMILPIVDTIAENLVSGDSYWRKLGEDIRRLALSILSAISLKTPYVDLEGEKALNKWQTKNKLRSDYINWLRELQKALDTARTSDPDRRIVIMIDDLDRCLPSKVIDVLESIKVMLDVPGFIFVLALDESTIIKAVDNYYGPGYGISSKDYVKKLVQVEFRLPPLRVSDITEYTRMLQSSTCNRDMQVSHVLSQMVPMVAGDNPREVKRFINSVLLATDIMKNMNVQVSADQQVVFMAMEFRWPGISRAIVSDESLRKGMIELFNAKSSSREPSLSEKEVKNIEIILENNPGLERFLTKTPGNELLHMSAKKFKELAHYTSLTRERKAAHTEDLIYMVMSELTDRERRVLILRFGMEDGTIRTLKEVGLEFNLSAERIRQIEAKALRRLRHPSRSGRLRALLSSMDELDNSSQYILKAIFGSAWQDYLIVQQ